MVLMFTMRKVFIGVAVVVCIGGGLVVFGFVDRPAFPSPAGPRAGGAFACAALSEVLFTYPVMAGWNIGVAEARDPASEAECVVRVVGEAGQNVSGAASVVVSRQTRSGDVSISPRAQTNSAGMQYVFVPEQVGESRKAYAYLVVYGETELYWVQLLGLEVANGFPVEEFLQHVGATFSLNN